jgi:hypothetical protein
VSSNSGAWGIAMWRDDSGTQGEGISLSGGDAIDSALPTDPLGCLNAPPDGLGLPGIRAGDVVFAQTDGVVQFEDFYENRILTFRATICNDGCPGCPTGRAKAKRLLREWSRTCTGATLAIFTDCHDPDATNEERVVTGPYLVRGRPRAADLTWSTSDLGCADVLLRFDAQDHRLVILPEENDAASPWTGTLCEDVLTEGDAARVNDLLDPRQRATAWALGGGTATQTRPTTGGPHNQGYFQQAMTVQNASNMTIPQAGTGTSGRPVVAGQKVYVSAYWYKSVTTGVQRIDVAWYDAAGVLLSTTAGSDLAIATANVWWRAGQSFTAPANAAFYTPILTWNGTYTAGTTVRVADALAEVFEAAETSAEGIYFDGAWLGSWTGTADASTSTSRVARINYAWDPRGTTGSQWAVNGGSGSSVAESLLTSQSDGPVISGVTTDTYVRYTWLTGNSGGTPSVQYSALHVPTEAFEIGDQVTVSLYVRPSIAIAAHTVFLSQQVNGADGANVNGAAEGALTANVWTRVDATLTLTVYAEGINEAGVSFGTVNFPTGTTVDVAYALIERVGATDDYFDGNSDLSVWQGTENASISLQGEGEAAAVGTDVTVVGDLCAYPVFELTGPLTGPITIYYDGDSTIVYNGDIGVDDAPVFIDTRYTRAYQAGVDVSANLSGSLAAALPLGTTMITVTSGPLDTGTVQICWQNAVISG